MKLTERQTDFLDALVHGRRLRLADRTEDRARQFCRKNGLAVIVKNPRRWEITDAGRSALKAAREQQ